MWIFWKFRTLCSWPQYFVRQDEPKIIFIYLVQSLFVRLKKTKKTMYTCQHCSLHTYSVFRKCHYALITGKLHCCVSKARGQLSQTVLMLWNVYSHLISSSGCHQATLWNSLESLTLNALRKVFLTLLLQHGIHCPLWLLETLHQAIFIPWRTLLAVKVKSPKIQTCNCSTSFLYILLNSRRSAEGSLDIISKVDIASIPPS